ncbi:MAG: hypothetical protein CM15mP112_04950 [Flavobacteriales bacterium]|nr:MAG: hypothetical protein CM15mP112_04950 [Flavobacteriales bacterium]
MIKHFKILFFLLIFASTCFSQTKSLNFKNDTLLLHPKFSAFSSIEKENNNLFLLGISLKLKHNHKTNFNITYDYLKIDNINIIKNYYDSLSIYPNFNNKNVRLRYSINHQFNSFFNIDVGKGNNFIGEGHRSLLLSNVQAPYSYVKLTTKFGKVTYKNLYSTLYNLNNNNLVKKFSATHYLNIDINSNLNIGIFESVLWQSRVGSYNIGYEIGYLNPIIFYRPIEFSMGSDKGNALMGLNLTLKIKNHKFYGQFLLDDLNISRQKDSDKENYSSGFFQNKYGYQLGARFSYKNLNYNLEYNQVQPYTYAHKIPFQNYSHMNQSLAHPLGANFKEVINIVKFKKDNFLFSLSSKLIKIGLDSVASHFGQNIFNIRPYCK